MPTTTLISITPEELQKLCDEHWEYVEQVIRNEYESEMAYPQGSDFSIDAYCRRIRLHYITAMVHGFKHGVQWIEKSLEDIGVK